jgi:hypothetical protein
VISSAITAPQQQGLALLASWLKPVSLCRPRKWSMLRTRD